MKQVHGDDIVEVADTSIKEAGAAGAMVTAEPNVFLGVLSADCVPILFVAPKERLVAAVHAGWRGTHAGIGAKTVKHFADNYNIAAGSLEAALARPSAPAVMKSAMTSSSRSARAGESWQVPASNDPPPSPISTCGD
jgi:copper oxidase (laccase) domain-containing protein